MAPFVQSHESSIGKLWGYLMKYFGLGLMLLVSVTSFAERPSDIYLQKFLKLFKSDSKKALNLLPPKYNKKGQPFAESRRIPFRVKKMTRQKYCPKAPSGGSCLNTNVFPLSEISGDSNLKNFFGSERVQTYLEKLSVPEILSSKSMSQPWSGDYWATYKAGIAARYADPDYPNFGEFNEYLEYFKNKWNIDLQNKDEVDQLSPAEKYDLLLGLKDRPLAKNIIDEAKDIYRSNNNKIDTWFGICHGWAPASFMLARPTRFVEVESIIPNLKIRFNPDDIKALASHLWANTTLQSRTMGGRCDDENPQMDESGRIISENCYDINPGSWHTAVINQLGIKRQTFVIDATYDYQVWNQPVVSYKLSFFNPEDSKPYQNFKEAMINLPAYTKDPFKKYRSQNSVFVVGVSMELTYVAENSASDRPTDGEENDSLRTVQYIYDLEINAQGKIIGGEWYQNAHPDFMWAPANKARAVSVVDRELQGSWQGNGSPPQSWQKKAEFAAGYSQPLAAVVEHLISLAK